MQVKSLLSLIQIECKSDEDGKERKKALELYNITTLEQLNKTIHL
jgi:hypothetical protein